jgi:hypothetical protein
MTLYEYILLMTVTFTLGVTFGYITETIRLERGNDNEND